MRYPKPDPEDFAIKQNEEMHKSPSFSNLTVLLDLNAQILTALHHDSILQSKRLWSTERKQIFYQSFLSLNTRCEIHLGLCNKDFAMILLEKKEKGKEKSKKTL